MKLDRARGEGLFESSEDESVSSGTDIEDDLEAEDDDFEAVLDQVFSFNLVLQLFNLI
jgi:hypothetical protein